MSNLSVLTVFGLKLATWPAALSLKIILEAVRTFPKVENTKERFNSFCRKQYNFKAVNNKSLRAYHQRLYKKILTVL